MVQVAAPGLVLQARLGGAEGAVAFCQTDQGMINEEPSFGYRTVATLHSLNRHTVQRLFQLRGWQVTKRPIRFRLGVQALPSVATAANQR